MFYCSERIMRIYFDWKTRVQRERSRPQLQLKNSRDTETASDEDKKQESSGLNRSTLEEDKAFPGRGDRQDKKMLDDNHAEQRNDHLGDHGRGDEAMSHTHNNQAHYHHCHDSIHPHEIITRAIKRDLNKSEPKTGVASTISNGPPSINVPRKATEIAPVAWMIIIGDGLHNFIDGLSIGAAFTESIYQGMIICIAVIFEELPHELGDFAVLISSGMTVRQALGFNFLSACTCYIGMVFGIILGDTTQSASFIFALAAGMFFYISLVDMMGELSAALEECKHSTRKSAHLLLMQNIGILSGITIIFSLSLFGPGA